MFCWFYSFSRLVRVTGNGESTRPVESKTHYAPTFGVRIEPFNGGPFIGRNRWYCQGAIWCKNETLQSGLTIAPPSIRLQCIVTIHACPFTAGHEWVQTETGSTGPHTFHLFTIHKITMRRSPPVGFLFYLSTSSEIQPVQYQYFCNFVVSPPVGFSKFTSLAGPLSYWA